MAEPTQAAAEKPPETTPEVKSEPPAYSEAPGEKPATTEPTAPTAAETNAKAPASAAAEAKKPYDQLLVELGALLKEADYDEVYGLKLSPAGDLQTSIILQKFLRANANDLPKAKEQLLSTLKWRKEFQPLKAKDELFSKERFSNLGYVVQLKDVPDSSAECPVVTFNVYGGVKDNEVTFEDIPGFIRWRVALMELGLSKTLAPLLSGTSTTPVPEYGSGPDLWQGIQVHDYLNVSFLRQNPYVKAASKEAISTFSKYYPETLSRKFFVNVPVVMGWMFQAMKLILPKETVKKFSVLSYGNQLAAELGKGVPKAYGGDAEDLEAVGEGLKLE